MTSLARAISGSIGNALTLPYMEALPPDFGNVVEWYAFNKGIVVVGAGVDIWKGRKNGRDLLQATDTNRPSAESDGTILFDGVDNYLQTATFTYPQPATIYALGRQVTYTTNDQPFCGFSTAPFWSQSGGTPAIVINPGSAAGASNSDWIVNVYAALATIADDTSSLIQINNGTPTTGGSGTAAMAGFTLGARGNATFFSNTQYKEIILYSGSHGATLKTAVIAYLSKVGGLGL